MEMRIKPSGRHKRCLWSREAVSSSCSVCGFDVLPQCRLATDSAVCVVVQSMARTTQTVREGNLFTRVFPEQQIKWGFRRRCDDLAFFLKYIYIYIWRNSLLLSRVGTCRRRLGDASQQPGDTWRGWRFKIWMDWTLSGGLFSERQIICIHCQREGVATAACPSCPWHVDGWLLCEHKKEPRVRVTLYATRDSRTIARQFIPIAFKWQTLVGLLWNSKGCA